MKMKRGTVYQLGSCNFCDKGKLSASGYNLLYPYNEVFEISGRGLAARLCDDCIEKLNDAKESNDAKRVADILSEC